MTNTEDSIVEESLITCPYESGFATKGTSDEIPTRGLKFHLSTRHYTDVLNAYMDEFYNY
jgi:predicted nucleic acid-binding Zn finger protein